MRHLAWSGFSAGFLERGGDKGTEQDDVERGVEQRRMPDETIETELADGIAQQPPRQRRAKQIAEHRGQIHATETDFLDHAATGSGAVGGPSGAGAPKTSPCCRNVI